MTEPSIGRTVHFKLGADDAAAINRRRLDPQQARPVNWADGAQAHIGNKVAAGDVYPAMIVRVWSASTGLVQLQVFLDGNDTYWATSIHEGDGERQYSWPPRV